MSGGRPAPRSQGSAGTPAQPHRVDARKISVAVDLHCHILPGLDDGARDLDDAVGMALQARADGIAAICATPHIRDDHEVAIGELPSRLAELTAAVAEAGGTTRILPGGELAAGRVDSLDDDQLAAVSLGGSRRWMLLEPSPGPLDSRLDAAVTALRDRGYRTLIAHPERHLAADLVQRLAALIQDGALVQATAASFTDEASREGMLTLAGAGVIHVLGSDSHSSRAGRPVAVAGALDMLGRVPRLSAHLDWIGRTAPAGIVRGHGLSPPFAPRPASPAGW
jgi:protein-tyrosine phosphatase